MTDLRVIDGGRSLTGGKAETIEAAEINLRRRVQRAERNARVVVGLLAPAFAVINNGDTELAAMIASAHIDEAIAIARTFAKAAVHTRSLADTLQEAAYSLSAAIDKQAKPPKT